MPTINIQTDLDEALNKLQQICNKLDEAEEKAQRLQFITPKKLAEMTGWSLKIAQETFRRKDFPTCDFGKEQIAYVEAVRNYFLVARRKENESG